MPPMRTADAVAADGINGSLRKVLCGRGLARLRKALGLYFERRKQTVLVWGESEEPRSRQKDHEFLTCLGLAALGE